MATKKTESAITQNEYITVICDEYTEQGHIVRKFYDKETGHYRGCICDDCCISEEQVPELLRRIARNAQRALAAVEAKQQTDEVVAS